MSLPFQRPSQSLDNTPWIDLSDRIRPADFVKRLPTKKLGFHLRRAYALWYGEPRWRQGGHAPASGPAVWVAAAAPGCLDERQRLLLLGAEALELGRGGIKAMARATGVHPDTVSRGVREAEGRPEPRVRAPGGAARSWPRLTWGWARR
jgi:hypothetical protein